MATPLVSISAMSLVPEVSVDQQFDLWAIPV
jgi:hypothetical protein